MDRNANRQLSMHPVLRAMQTASQPQQSVSAGQAQPAATQLPAQQLQQGISPAGQARQLQAQQQYGGPWGRGGGSGDQGRMGGGVWQNRFYASPAQQAPASSYTSPGNQIPTSPAQLQQPQQPQLDPAVSQKLSFDDLMYLVQLNQGKIAPGADGSYRLADNFGGGPGNFSFEDLMQLTKWYKEVTGKV